MIRYMSSVVRPARQIIYQKPFSTKSNVRFSKFEKNVEKLQKEQFETQTDSQPTFLKDNAMYLSVTCLFGVITGAMAVETIYDFIKTY